MLMKERWRRIGLDADPGCDPASAVRRDSGDRVRVAIRNSFVLRVSIWNFLTGSVAAVAEEDNDPRWGGDAASAPDFPG